MPPDERLAPTPAVYQMHGGGMILGDRRTALPDALDLAASVGATVISVEYRLAPEHPYPAPVEDCYAGLFWVAANAGELNIDPDRIVVAGPSSGGGLAAAVALLARDRGGPALASQMLLAPMLDNRNDSASARQMAGRWAGGAACLVRWIHGFDVTAPEAAVSQAAKAARTSWMHRILNT
jgi:acetyl esterase/lipase